MSRVDEARRRAAEAAARNDAPGWPDVTQAVGVDPAELAGESYPIELPDHDDPSRTWMRAITRKPARLRRRRRPPPSSSGSTSISPPSLSWT